MLSHGRWAGRTTQQQGCAGVTRVSLAVGVRPLARAGEEQRGLWDLEHLAVLREGGQGGLEKTG